MQTQASAKALFGSEGLLHQIFTFIYTIAHQIGLAAGKGFAYIFNLRFPDNLVDPVGFLTVITLFLILVCLTRKVAIWVVVIGWALMAIRLLMVIFKR